MQRAISVCNQLSIVILLFGGTMLVPMLVGSAIQDLAMHAYDRAVSVTILSGGVLWWLTRGQRSDLQIRDGFLLVVLVWLALPSFATLPLLFYLPELTFTDAFFETMSGLTTTGSTVLSGLDRLPPSLNLWRHQLHWLGGLGIIVLAVAIFPMLGIGGRQIYMAETPGPMKDSKLTPRITQTAKGLWLVYTLITLAGVLALRLAGMSWLDAVCHAFSVMGLGGFSTHDASVGYFDSPLIEAILIIFMLVAGVNFSTHFLAWRGKSLRPYAGDIEFKPFVGLVLLSCVGMAVYVWQMGTYSSYWTALRHVSFNLVSVATDCGFVSVDFGVWPSFATLWMLFLSSISACSGSTGGGIKMVRTLILYKQARREMQRLLHPAMMNPMKIGTQLIPNNVAFSVLGFIFVYFMSVVSLTFVLVASGLDFLSALSAVIACINNMGPGLGVVGPAGNFSVLTDMQTWVCSLAMLLGRLEVFILLIVLTPGFWRK
jgi:trk system potassium uptake protein